MGAVRRILRDLLPGPVRERYHRFALRRDFGIDRETGARRPTRIEAANASGVNLVGYWESPTGIGQSARALERAAIASGIPVARVDAPGPTGSRLRRVPRYNVNVYHVNADAAASVVEELGPALHSGRANVGYWYWESEAFPESWQDRFDYFDEIWVASEFCRRAISRSSPIPVVLAPPAILLEAAGAPRSAFGLPATGTFFLTIADLASGRERKNPEGTVRAFVRAFGSSGEAFLLAVCRGADEHPALVEELRRSSEGARVVILPRTVSREEIEGLLAACDAYVSLHRAEGFGFPIAEAMSLGKPAVATDFSGNRDYLDEATGFPVRWRPFELQAPAGPYETGTRWADPDEGHAAEALLSIARQPAEAARRGEAARLRIRELYSPEASGRRIAERLDRLRNRLARIES